MKALVNSPSFPAEHLREEVLSLPRYSFYVLAVLGLHFVADSVILVGLWSNRVWEAFRARRRGDM